MFFNLIIKHFSFLKNIPLIPNIFDLLLVLFCFTFNNKIFHLISKLESELIEWKNVKRVLHKYGGLQFNINNKELCHIHGNGLIDLNVSKDDYIKILNEGIATKHHVFKNSNWISLYLKTEEDFNYALILLSRKFEKL